MFLDVIPPFIGKANLAFHQQRPAKPSPPSGGSARGCAVPWGHRKRSLCGSQLRVRTCSRVCMREAEDRHGAIANLWGFVLTRATVLFRHPCLDTVLLCSGNFLTGTRGPWGEREMSPVVALPAKGATFLPRKPTLSHFRTTAPLPMPGPASLRQ